jgi:DHA1 family inner membrane transport protein
MAVGGFAIGTTEFASMGLVPTIASSFSVAEPAIGHLITAYAVGVVVGAPVLAALTARVPRRVLLMGLMGVFVLGHVLSVLATDLTMLTAARFLSGLPHGAYFGIAAVVASTLVPPERRGRAIAAVMLGLTVANIGGVPMATAIGQTWGWRTAYLVVGGLGLLTIVGVRLLVPPVPAQPGAGIRSELGALRRGQLWLTMGIGIVGFGGMFAVYTYISSTLTELSGIPLAWVPAMLALYGVGMTIGALVGGRLTDRSISRTVIIGLVVVTVVMAVFPLAVRTPVTAALEVLLIGAVMAAIVPALQARLLDVARPAETLPASLSHAALNVGNGLGAWLGGIVITTGLGYSGTGPVGAVLAAMGLVIAVISFRRPVPEPSRQDVPIAAGTASSRE